MTQQGLYDAISVGTTPEQLNRAVAEMYRQRAAGFTWLLNTNASYGSLQNMLTYAAEAFKMGMNLIWPLHHPNFYNGTKDLSTGGFKDQCAYWNTVEPLWIRRNILVMVRGIPSVKMIYGADEPGPAKLTACTEHLNALKLNRWNADPRILTVHWGMNGVATEAVPYANASEVIGMDCYPVGWNGLTLNSVRNVATDLKAKVPNKTRVMVCQAFSWHAYGGTNPEQWPTANEYTIMRNNADAASPQVTLWWTAYAIRRASNATERWNDLVQGVFA